jgi:hypothetical protein
LALTRLPSGSLPFLAAVAALGALSMAFGLVVWAGAVRGRHHEPMKNKTTNTLHFFINLDPFMLLFNMFKFLMDIRSACQGEKYESGPDD